MNRIYLIRHGLTAGNEEKRYIGRTDQPLSQKGMVALKGRNVPLADEIVISPMLRCRQTAELLFPGRRYQVIDDFRECDFGKFEGKNYLELSDDPDYIEWIASYGKNMFPGGEDPKEFRKRCAEAFREYMSGIDPNKTVAFVVHGGTIMAISEMFDREQKDFYEYSLPNGQGVEAVWENGILTIGRLLW